MFIIVHDSFLLQSNSCNNNYSRPIRLIFFNIQNNPYLKVKLTCFASISINLSQHHSHGLSTIIIVPIATLDNNVMRIWMNKRVRERISGVIRAITEDVVLSGFLISTILPVRLYCVVLFSRSYDSMGLDTKERCWSGRWKCTLAVARQYLQHARYRSCFFQTVFNVHNSMLSTLFVARRHTVFK